MLIGHVYFLFYEMFMVLLIFLWHCLLFSQFLEVFYIFMILMPCWWVLQISSSSWWLLFTLLVSFDEQKF